MNSSDRIAWSSVITITKFGAPFALGGRGASSSARGMRPLRPRSVRSPRRRWRSGDDDRNTAQRKDRVDLNGAFAARSRLRPRPPSAPPPPGRHARARASGSLAGSPRRAVSASASVIARTSPAGITVPAEARDDGSCLGSLRERQDRRPGAEVLVELEVRELRAHGVGDQEQGVGGALERKRAVALERPDDRDASRRHVAIEGTALVLGQRPGDHELELGRVLRVRRLRRHPWPSAARPGRARSSRSGRCRRARPARDRGDRRPIRGPRPQAARGRRRF